MRVVAVTTREIGLNNEFIHLGMPLICMAAMVQRPI